jgi:hypothetical protein
MKRWKKLLLLLLGVVLLSQLPFAWRRYKLGRLQRAITQLNSQRVATNGNDGYAEYKGVLHVHSFLGGHSNGTFEEMIAGARANQLDFVGLTEHPAANFDTAAMTLKGNHGGVLFLNGNELSTATQDRLLVLPGDDGAVVAASASTQEVISQHKAKGSFTVIAYPQDFKSWNASGYDGVEVYNLFTNARTINPVIMFFDGLWSYRGYPDLLFSTFYARPQEDLILWDHALTTTGARIAGTAGNDAHSNVGLSLNDSTGKTLVGIKLDPYERSFRIVREHVLIPQEQTLTADSLLAALREGHSFIAFDIFGDATGFSFSATNGAPNEKLKIQGDEINLGNSTRLIVNLPVAGRIVLFRDGNQIQEKTGTSLCEFSIREKGIYRVEIYLPQLPAPVGSQPWIISNPIYIK